MSNTTKNIYKTSIDNLQKVELLIDEYQQFTARLLRGSDGISISLRIDKPKEDENYLEKEKKEYGETASVFSGLIFSIDRDRTKNEKTIDTTYQKIDERIAINMCKMILDGLIAERDRLLRVLGATVKSNTKNWTEQVSQ